MILIQKQNNNLIKARHIGNDKKEFFRFFMFIKSLEARKFTTNGFIIDSKFTEQLQNEFDTEIDKPVWDDMGADMKLSPFSYQKEAIYFCLHHLNSLVICPPGTGKTSICIGTYLELLKHNITDKPGAICVKASLKYQWVKEIQKFSNLRAKAIDTPAKAKKKFDSQFEDVDLMVLNYETFKNEQVRDKLREVDIECIILDEVHTIGSSFKTAKARALYNFNDLKVKIGLTATPITRDPENLFSIFNMIDPNLFKNHSRFARDFLIYRTYGQIAGIKNKEVLKNKIAPYMFIKTEEQIAKQLPELIVSEVHCEMTKDMAKINTMIFDKLDDLKKQSFDIEKNTVDKKQLETNEEYNMMKAQILAYQTFAQELIDDPRLFDLSDSVLVKDLSCKDKTSPKLDLLLDLLDNIITSNKSKVCIFTRFERMQAILKDKIENKFKTKCAIVNGSLDSKERQRQAYDLFQETDEYSVLIATNAMSEGISLSACNYLIEYDLADSYAMQTQRHGRVRRANSVHKTSYVYQLIMDEPNGDSWDLIAQKIIDKKRNYDNDIIQDLNKE